MTRERKITGSKKPRSPVKEQPDSDIDIAMLKANLKRTYAQRIHRHQIALDTFLKLRKAKFL